MIILRILFLFHMFLKPSLYMEHEQRIYRTFILQDFGLMDLVCEIPKQYRKPLA